MFLHLVSPFHFSTDFQISYFWRMVLTFFFIYWHNPDSYEILELFKAKTQILIDPPTAILAGQLDYSSSKNLVSFCTFVFLLKLLTLYSHGFIAYSYETSIFMGVGSKVNFETLPKTCYSVICTDQLIKRLDKNSAM